MILKEKRMSKQIKEQLKEEIEVASTLFYQRKDQQAWEKVNAIIGLILNYIDQIQNTEQVAILNKGLVEVAGAMERKDTILIADELVHTILPVIETTEE